MNKLPGIITEIISEGQLSIVKIKVGSCIFCSIVIDTPQTAPYLQTGKPVDMLFKENEVVIAKAFTGAISMQNKFGCVVQSMARGKLLTEVTMTFNEFTLASLITTQAAMQLELQAGDPVTAMVKTNEISLAPYDRL